MDFIMRVCKKVKCFIAGWVCLLAMASLSTASADFQITDIQPVLKTGSLQVSGNLELILTAKVEEATDKGIPINVDIQLRLYKKRPYLWAKELSRWVLRRQIRYHALSGQYLVSDRNPGHDANSTEVLENFTSLQQALRHMGILSEIELPFKHDPVEKDKLVLDARVSLVIETLPAPLRPVAYTSLDWHLDSGWSSWTVQP